MITETNVEDFIISISKEVRLGWRFTPLLGSGISAPSGIPVASCFPVYFNHCITQLSARANKETPYTWIWPQFSEMKDWDNSNIATNVISLLSNRIDSHIKRLDSRLRILSKRSEMDSKIDKQSCEKVVRELKSIRDDMLPHISASIHDWRVKLECLARLFDPDAKIPGTYDQRVVDSFFTFATSGKRPSVGHYMLAHLSDALRIRTVLTTNFDSLTEEAFAAIGPQLAIFDVHLNAELPDPRLVWGNRALVKLHGGKYGLRANASLIEDVPLEHSTSKTFNGYFRSGSNGDTCDSHLFVMGASCGEKRTVSLIKNALKDNKEMKVFWVCYTQEDIRQVKETFSALPPETAFSIIQHNDLGLFLFHLYQSIYHSLPPAGAEYPAFWRTPPASKSGNENEAKKIVNKIESCLTNPAEPRLFSVDGKNGVTTICSQAWSRLAQKHHCVWLELGDFLNPEDAMVGLLVEIAGIVGMERPGPFRNEEDILPSEFQPRLEEALKRYVEGAHQKFVVFIDGRNGLGHSAGWEQPNIPGVPEPHQPSTRWTSRQDNKLWDYLKKVMSPTIGKWNRHIAFVVLVKSEPEDYEKPLLKKQAGVDPMPDCRGNGKPTQEIVDSAITWVNEHGTEADTPERRERFLYAITLFRHSRHPSAVFSWALIKAVSQLGEKDNDEARAKLGAKWIKTLLEKEVIRNKPGGFAWMHWNVRTTLRVRLECESPELKGLRSECHQGIADWYMKLYRSSRDPLAALESLYHRMCCIEFARNSTASEVCGNIEHIRETAFFEAIATLNMARQRIISCGYFTASSGIMVQMARAAERLGYPKATEFYGVLQEALRDYAREAADFENAHLCNEGLKASLYVDSRKLSDENSGMLGLNQRTALDVLYREALILTGLRSYDLSEEVFREFFAEIGLPHTGRGSRLWENYGVRDMRMMGRHWARLHKGDQWLLQICIRSCRRLMFLEMLVAQAEECAKSTNPSRPVMSGIVTVSRRSFAESVYVLATEVMRYIEGHEFLNRENAYIRTLYGVLLATRGRFSEAHRRFAEASCYLAHSEKMHDAVAIALLDLRKAETFLRALASTKKANDRQRIAMVWDARACLKRAGQVLDEAHRHDVWWNSLRHELWLWSSALLPQKNRNNKSECKQNKDAYHNGTLLTTDDPFRQARLTHLFLDCYPSSKITKNDLKNNLKRVLQKRTEEQFRRHPLTTAAITYLQHVGRKVHLTIDDQGQAVLKS